MNKKWDFRTLLCGRAKLYSMEFGGGNSWIPATQNYIPIVIIEERNSSTFIMYGISRGKIAVNVRINPNSWFNKMTTFFGSLKTGQDRQNVGMAFPPDGSIETFKEKLEDIKKHLLTIPSLRKNLKTISTTASRYYFAPIAGVVEAALAKEVFPIVEKGMYDAAWIQQQIAKGNLIPALHSLVNANARQQSLNPAQTSTSKPIPGILMQSNKTPGTSRHASKVRKTPTSVKEVLLDRKMNEAFLRDTIEMSGIKKPETKSKTDEAKSGKAQALVWQKRFAAKIEAPVVKGQGIRKDDVPPVQRPDPAAHKTENDLQKLRIENGLGDYVRALQALQQEHDDLELKISSLKQEREDMQQNIFNLSTGLSTYVTGLIKTDQVPFQYLEKTLYGLSEKVVDEPLKDEHQDPISMAAEKLRARRMILEEQAALIASKAKLRGIPVEDLIP